MNHFLIKMCVIIWIIRACFHKIAGIAEVGHSDPNDHGDYKENQAFVRG